VDRLAAAWTVACGCAMADHGQVAGYESGVVRIEVSDPVWQRQMISLRSTLAREMARIAGLPVTAIEFGPERSLTPMCTEATDLRAKNKLDLKKV
jgi:hypothetical protein